MQFLASAKGTAALRYNLDTEEGLPNMKLEKLARLESFQGSI